MSSPKVIHRIEGHAFCVQVEQHAEAPTYRITVRSTELSAATQLHLFECRISVAQAALELSRSLHLCAVMAGYLEDGGQIEIWTDDVVREHPAYPYR